MRFFVALALLTTSCIAVQKMDTLASNSCSALFGQCGGTGWTGPTTCCQDGQTVAVCKKTNDYYSQCVAACPASAPCSDTATPGSTATWNCNKAQAQYANYNGKPFCFGYCVDKANCFDQRSKINDGQCLCGSTNGKPCSDPQGKCLAANDDGSCPVGAGRCPRPQVNPSGTTGTLLSVHQQCFFKNGTIKTCGQNVKNGFLTCQAVDSNYGSCEYPCGSSEPCAFVVNDDDIICSPTGLNDYSDDGTGKKYCDSYSSPTQYCTNPALCWDQRTTCACHGAKPCKNPNWFIPHVSISVMCHAAVDAHGTCPSGTSACPAFKFEQCGGQGWHGATTCQSGLTCTRVNAYYSQCV